MPEMDRQEGRGRLSFEMSPAGPRMLIALANAFAPEGYRICGRKRFPDGMAQ